jgi:hypothetical protein
MYDKSQYASDLESLIPSIFEQYAVYFESGMLYVNDRYVVTTHGIFNKDTCEQIAKLTFTDTEKRIAFVITKTGNILAVDGGKIYIAIQK